MTETPVPDPHGVVAATALPAGITEASLRSAVAASKSWRAVMRMLGFSSAHRGRQMRTACDRLDIDYSHFSIRTWNDDQLRQLLSAARSWPELMSGLGYAEDSGSARATIRKHAARLGLDSSRLSEPPAPAADAPFTAPAREHHLRAAGSFIVAGACALAGYKVSWPLEPAIYDLLIDTGRLQRVQVKTTTWWTDDTWACKITHAQSRQKAWYTNREIDYFGVVDLELNVYMIPVTVVDGLGTIYTRRYAAYRLDRLESRRP